MYGHSYWCVSHQALTSNIKATFIASFMAPTNLKICLKLVLYMPHNQSICVTGGCAPSQSLGHKTNLQSVH